VGVENLIEPVLEQLIRDANSPVVVDLCSGSSGPYIRLCSRFREKGLPVKIVMTDKHPNTEAFITAERASGGAITGCRTPVDAMNVPRHLVGIRTLFNAFHHFRPEQARKLLKDACDSAQPILVVEITGRSVVRVLLTAMGSFLLMLAGVARMRPRRLRMWFFTYLVPILPLAFAWDAAVSCIRTYTVEELTDFASSLDARYTWQFGQLKMRRSIFSLSYFAGAPKASDGLESRSKAHPAG